MKKSITLLFFLLVLSVVVFAEITSKLIAGDAGGNSEVIFYEGNKIIAHKIFDERGSVKESIGNIPDGSVKGYYENGSLSDDFISKDGKIEGLWKKYYPNGQICGEISFKEDKQNGEYKTYYENGILRDEGNIKDGMLDGLNIGYNPSGKMRFKCNYVSGKRNGTAEGYSEDGTLEIVSNMRNDKPDGLLRIYHSNGNIQHEANYKNGVPEDGSIRDYDMDGNLTINAETAMNMMAGLTAKVLGENKNIDILSHKKNSLAGLGMTEIVGEIQNNTKRPIAFVTVSATYYNKKGKVIGTDTGYVGQNGNIDVGDKAPFEILNFNKIKYDHYRLRVN